METSLSASKGDAIENVSLLKNIQKEKHNMKKRFLAIFLALAFCMGLTLPAYAAPSPDETQKFFSLTYEINGKTFEYIKNGVFGERTNVSKDMKLALTDGRTLTGSGYNAVTSDTVFTAKHTGTVNDGSYIVISSTAFVNNGNGVYEQDWAISQVLTKDGFKDINVVEILGGAVLLRAGQSIQFKLPAVYSPQMKLEDDVFYFLELYLYYPGINGFQTMGMLPFKLDSEAVSTFLPSQEPITPTFTDVPAGEWYATPVAWAVEKNITNGMTTANFSPGQNCTHAQILTFLYRTARDGGVASAADMDKAVEWAREKGMIDNTFNGKKDCTRAEAVNYIWQACDKPTAKNSTSFTDVDADADYVEAVSWAVEKGVTNGSNADGTMFSPDQVCTRGHIVTFLYRAYHNVQPTHTWQGDPSLDFTAQLSTGESFTLSKQTGKVVLVNFWATFTWGITSVEELSVFSQLYSEYSTDEVKMVFINCGESPQTVQSFLDRAGCTLPVICDTNDTISSAYASANGTTLIPRTVIFGKDGTISADYFGSQSYQIVKSLIDNALEGRTD